MPSNMLPRDRPVAFFLVVLQAAELDAGLSFGAGAVESRSFQVVGAVLNVRAKFFFDFAGGGVAAEEPGGKGAD